MRLRNVWFDYAPMWAWWLGYRISRVVARGTYKLGRRKPCPVSAICKADMASVYSVLVDCRKNSGHPGDHGYGRYEVKVL